MNRIDRQLTSYTYEELTDIRRELQKENADLRIKLSKQRMQWILLKDDLPEQDSKSIVIMNDGACKILSFHSNSRHNLWWFDDSNMGYVAERVVKWIPLPLNLGEAE